MLNRNRLKMYGSKLAASSAVFVGAVGSAVAAVPTEVTGAMSDMKSDGITVATAFLVAAIAVAAFLFMRKGARA